MKYSVPLTFLKLYPQITNISPQQKHMLDAVREYQTCTDARTRLNIAKHLDKILLHAGQYVPILQIPGLYLKNPIIINPFLYVPGQVWCHSGG